MNDNEMLQGGEVSFAELWEQLCCRWKAVVGSLALGIAGAVAGIALIPPKYEAVALIQVGQVGQLGQLGQVKMGGHPVEPPAAAVERMRAPSFQRRVAEAVNDQGWLQDIERSATATTKTFALQVIKGTVGPDQVPLIELRAGADSPEAAKRKAEVAVAELIKAHAELALPTLARMRSELAINREKLAGAERDLAALTKVAVTGVKDDRIPQLALMLASLRIQMEVETLGLRQVIIALETALGSPATQPAHAIEEVFSPEKPMSPKKGLLLTLGSVGGLLAGVVWVLVAYAWRRNREFLARASLS